MALVRSSDGTEASDRRPERGSQASPRDVGPEILRVVRRPDSVCSRRIALRSRHGVNMRVLLIEDHGASAENLALILDTWGHDCRIAGDAEAGRAEAARFLPDVFLIDLKLPGEDGLAAASWFRADPRYQKAVIALVSGRDVASGPDQDSPSFDRVFRKPLDLESLKGFLDSLVSASNRA